MKTALPPASKQSPMPSSSNRPLNADEVPFNLSRFIGAQEKDYSYALAELRAGKKQTHWIWYVLPQLRGLGSSSMANFYGIGSMREAVAAMNALDALGAVQVLGPIDAAKFRSCLTLFRFVDPYDAIFSEALNKY